jgi:GTP-binding protein
MPGKTITVNFYDLDRKLLFVDLPGYGFARRNPEEKKQWSALTDGYFTNNPNRDRLKLVLQLIDSRAGITEDDAMMLNWLEAAEQPFAVVMTKCDKLNKTDLNAQLAALNAYPSVVRCGAPVVPFSSLSGVGKNEVWKLISQFTDLHP